VGLNTAISFHRKKIHCIQQMNYGRKSLNPIRIYSFNIHVLGTERFFPMRHALPPQKAFLSSFSFGYLRFDDIWSTGVAFIFVSAFGFNRNKPIVRCWILILLLSLDTLCKNVDTVFFLFFILQRYINFLSFCHHFRVIWHWRRKATFYFGVHCFSAYWYSKHRKTAW
jgi:hypothetical protein